MNYTPINGSALNGASTPNWIVRAAVAATAAAALLVAADATRITYATADSVTGATGLVGGTHTHVASVNASCSASSAAAPTALFAAACSSNGTATGVAAVLRQVAGAATGEGTATGIAIPAEELGESTGNAAATSVECLAHLVRPAASISNCAATSVPADSLITRYARTTASASATGRAEASWKGTGTTIYLHDGYVIDATGTATASFDDTKVGVSVTLGSFDFGQSTAFALPHVIFWGAASRNGIATSVTNARRTAYALASANSGSTGTVAGTRQHRTTVLATSVATYDPIRARATIQGSAPTIAFSSVIQAIAIKTVFAASTFAAQAVGTAKPDQNGRVEGFAGASGSATGTHLHVATAIGSATASGTVTGYSNTEISAPEDRTMIVQKEDRTMIVQYEERTMRIAA